MTKLKIYNRITANIASMYNTSLFAKLSILFNRTVYKYAMPQSPAADSKQPKTRILNKGIKRHK